VSADRSVAERGALKVYETMSLKVLVEQRREETRCLPVGFDRGVGADEWLPHPLVLQGAETSRSEQVAMMV
jgi:hypothetical protein